MIASAALGSGAAGTAQLDPPSGFRESYKLEAPASHVAKRPAQVWCARDDSAWRSAKRAAGGRGDAFTDDGASFYPAGICTTLEEWRPSSPVTSLFGLHLLVLVRESVRVSGVTNEALAQCQAKKRLAEVAIRFFGFKPRTAKIRKLVRLAYVRSSGTPSAC